MSIDQAAGGTAPPTSSTVVALSGGVGGAKLVLGLAGVVDPSTLTVIANTGDDFDHLGLRVCPDIDTLVYTLSGLSNPDHGWGRAGETDHVMEVARTLGEETWFFLGDKDLAMHITRSRRLAVGESLTSITLDICERLGVDSRILPMSNDFVSTLVETADGVLPFQHYFVRDRCEPLVKGFRFDGAETAIANPQVLNALSDNRLRAVVVAPSNPFISIDPILAVSEIRSTLDGTPAPVVAVSPIVDGDSIKGPTAKMMRELKIDVSPVEVARRYADFLDGFVLDVVDAQLAPQIEAFGIPVQTANTVMDSLEDRVMLARVVLEFSDALSRRAGDNSVTE